MSNDDLYSTDDLFDDSENSSTPISLEDVTSPLVDSDGSAAYSDTLDQIRENLTSLSSFNSVVFIDTYKHVEGILRNFIKDIVRYDRVTPLAIDYFHYHEGKYTLDNMKKLVHLERSLIIAHVYRQFIDGALDHLVKEEHYQEEISFTRYMYNRLCSEQNLSERYSALITDSYASFVKEIGFPIDQDLADTGVFGFMRTSHRLNWGPFCYGHEVEGIGPIKEAVINRNARAVSMGNTLAFLSTHIDNLIISHKGGIERIEIKS